MTVSIRKIAVIGLGRVGLPFAVSLHEAGFQIVGIDTNDAWIDRLAQGGDFPFHEPGFDTLPEISDSWTVRNGLGDGADVDAVIVTVGTPLDSNLTPNLGPIKRVIDSLHADLARGTLLIFRSTLGLGVTRALSKYLVRTGACKDGEPLIAYCPERLAEGKARVEIATLPQIISAANDTSYALCEQIFSRSAPRLHRVSFRQAELIKLLCNTSRYMNFAVSNWVHEFVLDQGIDPHTLLEIANDGYPRPIPDRPGFTAGTCLRKDYGLLVQDRVLGDFAIAAWRVNERQPLSLLDTAKRHVDLTDKTVAILGVGFKKDVDDIRDSLALKLAELLLPESEHVFYQDPYLVDQSIELGLTPLNGVPMAQVRDKADVIFIGANHSEYEDLGQQIRDWPQDRRRVIIDIWNVTGFKQTVTILEPQT